MRIRRNPLRMMGLSLCATALAQLKAPPAEAAGVPPPLPMPAPPASVQVDIHTALVVPAAAPTEVCLQSCAWSTLHPHMLNPENLNDGLIGDVWREPRENPGLASENVNIVFLLKRKKVKDNIGEQQQEEEVKEKLKRDGSSQQKNDSSNKKMMAKVKEEKEEVNKKLKQDAISQQKKGCSNKKMMATVMEEKEEEVNKKLKRDGSSQQKKGCSNKKMMATVMEEKEINKKLKRDGSSQQKKDCSNKKMMAKVKEEEEEEEEEEEVNKKLKQDGSSQQKKDCSNKKMMVEVIKVEEVATAHKPSRCKRSDGRNWRCSKRAALPHTLCENHLHKSRSSYNKRKEARSKSANSQKASAISSEADPWKASSSRSKRARTSAPPSWFISTGAATLVSDAPESSKAAPPPPSPMGAWPRSKRQRKKKGDDYSSGAFHYPEPFGPFRGKQRGNYGSLNRAEASTASDDEALEEAALEGVVMLGSKVVIYIG